jgi:ActR/RegA family two-component response regulator
MDRTDVRNDVARSPAELSASSRHVLLVMDDHLYARTTERWLSKRGWQVTRAKSITQAYERWRGSGAEIALVDLDDDGLGGFTLLTAGQRLSPPRRAVLCTQERAVAGLPESTRRRLGIVEIVLRPCHLDLVLAALERTHALLAPAEAQP